MDVVILILVIYMCTYTYMILLFCFRYIISDDSDINTPAVAAAYAVKKYVKQAQDEISFQVGTIPIFINISNG